MDKHFLERYVEPHGKISRKVEANDYERLKSEASILFELCSTPRGIYKNAIAIAHQQIDARDPLRFFVCCDGRVVINPEIINQTRFKVDSKEACMSFPDKKSVTVLRSHKITVESIVLDVKNLPDITGVVTGKTAPVLCLNLSGRDAFVFQHEIDHFDCKYIYGQEEDE